jgi:DNA-binding response OmpR family regulator
MAKILLIEDELNLRKPLQDYLSKEGFEVICAESVQEAEQKIIQHPDLILLDWMLPDGQGIELLKKWRGAKIFTPVIMLTARVGLVDKVLGLELGADDYITKPFEPRELVARIHARLRSKTSENSSKKLVENKKNIEVGDFSLNFATREAFYGKKLLELTKTEFELLKILLENPNQVFSREELLKNVWGYDQYPTTRTVDNHIMQLRQKSDGDCFETVHGIGYRFRLTKK